MVFGAAKFTISNAPGAMTCGIPTSPAASSLLGPALRIPPTSSSANSVVVASRTPAINPLRIRSSIARPPVPVA